MTPILEAFSEKPSGSGAVDPPPGTACVIIGRNEGPRLIESLQSVQAIGLPQVYVDSGSIDGSADAAEERGYPVVRLDPARPFSAARGRNEGLDEVMRRWPETRFILFLDGDCTVDPRFPSAAIGVMERDQECAILTGHLSEQYPDRSIYNRLCSIEWQSPAGRIENLNALGGIMVGRVAAFQEVGGFNPMAIAGEEADLAVRLRLAGYSVIKADVPMATHDARMTTFAQWWTRAVRGGFAFAHRFAEHRRQGLSDGRREVLSALFWGLGVPLLILITLIPTRGLSVLMLGGYMLLGLRMILHYRRSGLSLADAFLVSRFNLYAKFAHVVGMLRYLASGPNGARLIEYK